MAKNKWRGSNGQITLLKFYCEVMLDIDCYYSNDYAVWSPID